MSNDKPAQQGRAGQYVRQTRRYSAFIPAPLPPDPPVLIEGDLQALLTKADQTLKSLNDTFHGLPNPTLALEMCVRKESLFSSRIEGVESTLQDVLLTESKIRSRIAQGEGSHEVINYVNAMKHGIGRLPEVNLSVRLLKEVHKVLMHGVRGYRYVPGELRATQNWIGDARSTIRSAVFVPPPPSKVPSSLDELERFLCGKDDIPALVRAGLAHVQFETIHPFPDGNGRLGRLLITFVLHEQGILTRPVLYISRYIDRHRDEYYRRLQAVRDEGGWEGWLEFFLRGVIEVGEDAIAITDELRDLRAKHIEVILTGMKGRSSDNGYLVLNLLQESPVVTVADIQQAIGKGFHTANRTAEKLVELGILKELSGQRRHRQFAYRDIIALFDEDSSRQED